MKVNELLVSCQNQWGKIDGTKNKEFKILICYEDGDTAELNNNYLDNDDYYIYFYNLEVTWWKMLDKNTLFIGVKLKY